MISLQSLKAVSNENRSATVVRMSATLAEGSVQKNATHPVGSFTSTTRITPPTGRQVARNVLYRLTVGFPYRSNTPVVQPRCLACPLG